MGRVLDLLESKRVFGLTVTSFGEYEFLEKCDDYYSVTITKDELSELIEELKKMLDESDGIMKSDCIDEGN